MTSPSVRLLHNVSSSLFTVLNGQLRKDGKSWWPTIRQVHSPNKPAADLVSDFGGCGFRELRGLLAVPADPESLIGRITD